MFRSKTKWMEHCKKTAKYIYIFFYNLETTNYDKTKCTHDIKEDQRSLRDSTILHGVCVGEMLVLKVICDALTH